MSLFVCILYRRRFSRGRIRRVDGVFGSIVLYRKGFVGCLVSRDLKFFGFYSMLVIVLIIVVLVILDFRLVFMF